MATNEASFRIVGNVVRTRFAQSGKAAFLTIDVMAHPRPKKIDCIAFREQVADVRELRTGQAVYLTGDIDMECLKSRAGEKVKIDGYEKWTPMLVVRSVEVEESSKQAPHGEGEKAAEGFDENAPDPFSGTDIPF